MSITENLEVCSTDVAIDSSLSVNETILRHPETMPVFEAFGLDTCCRGGLPVETAASKAGVDYPVLVRTLLERIRAQQGRAGIR
jgi:regulator of cell morphogenesis and NO signaling